MPKHNKKYTREDLEQAVLSSYTWAEVCRKVGIKPATGSQSHLKARVVKEGIDFSHFKGKHFKKGMILLSERQPLELYLNNQKPIKSHTLRNRLIQEGYKECRCEKCGLSEWLGEEVPLELDHIDSNHWNNNISNLQILCPNCHAILTRERRKLRRKK